MLCGGGMLNAAAKLLDTDIWVWVMSLRGAN